MNSIIIFSISLKINLNFRVVFSMESNYKQSLHNSHLNLKNISRVSNKYKNFLMLILLDTKDLVSLDSKWYKIIIKHKCFMEIFSVEKMMSLKKKIPINKFHRRDLNFQMTQVLKIQRKKESLKEKILMKTKQMLKMQIKILTIKKNNVSKFFYILNYSYLFRIKYTIIENLRKRINY